MTWEPRKPKWDWRAHLTRDEQRLVSAIERELRKAEEKRAHAAARLSPIRNRAIHRAKYDLEKANG